MRTTNTWSKAASILVAATLLFSTSSNEGDALTLEFHGAGIHLYLNTQSSNSQIEIPLNSIESDSSFPSNANFSIENVLETNSMDVNCVGAPTGQICPFPTSALQNLLSGIPNWQVNLESSIQLVGHTSTQAKYIWPIFLSVVDSEVPASIDASDTVDGEYLVGVDPKTIQINLRVLNRFDQPIDAELSVELNSRLIYSGPSSVINTQLMLKQDELLLGENFLTIEAQTEYGDSSASHKIIKSLPIVDNISISAPKEFYPKKDNYLDSLQFNVEVVPASAKAFLGTGLVQISTASGKILFSATQKRPGAYSYIYKPPASGFYVGPLTITSSFQPNGGKKVAAKRQVNSSPKKMVETTGRLTKSAWSAMYDCGYSYDPCKKGSLSGSNNGIELYNDLVDLDHRSEFQIPLPSGTHKWRLTFGTLYVGVTGASYDINSTDSSFSTGSGYLGGTPSSSGWEGNWTSSWSYAADESKASWVMTSDNWGSIYFQTVTVQYVKRTLK